MTQQGKAHQYNTKRLSITKPGFVNIFIVKNNWLQPCRRENHFWAFDVIFTYCTKPSITWYLLQEFQQALGQASLEYPQCPTAHNRCFPSNRHLRISAMHMTVNNLQSTRTMLLMEKVNLRGTTTEANAFEIDRASIVWRPFIAHLIQWARPLLARWHFSYLPSPTVQSHLLPSSTPDHLPVGNMYGWIQLWGRLRQVRRVLVR